MTAMRLWRAGFLYGAPLAIVFHVLTARSSIASLRAAGLLAAIAILLYFTGLAYLPCPRCGAPFFGSFAGNIWGPWRIFRRRLRCASCNHTPVTG